MKSTDVPSSKFPIAFANNAAVGTIRPVPQASQGSVTPGAASLYDGFPAINAQPLASGGVPPSIQDFNGVLNQITGWVRLQNAGAHIPYDQAFSNAIGGYPAGAVLASAITPTLLFLNSVDNNQTNPDSSTASGWLTLATTASASSIVNNFILAKPASLTLFVDPINGNDANDGSLPSKSLQSIDAALNKTQSYTLVIYILNNVQWSGRYNIYNSVLIQGVTADANGNITGYVNRTIAFLPEASNSPTAQGRCNSGAFLYGPSIQFDHIYLLQPDSASGLVVYSHLQILQGGTVTFTASTIAPTSNTGSGTLVGSPSNQGGGYFTAATNLSGNCPGRLFAGVPSGGNPASATNNYYRSNLTSA